MAMQRIVVDLIPGAIDSPVINASQFDNGRQFEIELLNGGEAFSPSENMIFELHVKKRDGNIIVDSPINRTDNILTFETSEQMTACHGKNICEVAISDDDLLIGTANFILEVEKDPTEGGITSESEINNLNRQIANAAAVIVPDVVNEVAPAIVRRETIERIEEYGGTWVLSDTTTPGSYDIYFRHRLIASEDYTAYKVFSTDPGVIVDNFTIPTSGVLKVTLSQPVNPAADYMLQIFKPFGS